MRTLFIFATILATILVLVDSESSPDNDQCCWSGCGCCNPNDSGNGCCSIPCQGQTVSCCNKMEDEVVVVKGERNRRISFIKNDNLNSYDKHFNFLPFDAQGRVAYKIQIDLNQRACRKFSTILTLYPDFLFS